MCLLATPVLKLKFDLCPVNVRGFQNVRLQMCFIKCFGLEWFIGNVGLMELLG